MFGTRLPSFQNLEHMRHLFIAFVFIISYSESFSQIPFDISLEDVQIENLEGVQSYAFGEADGKWLIVGGRLDGLHRRQPFAAFDVPGHNTDLIVIDPVNKKHWKAPLSVLTTRMAEQLSSTNMEFIQLGKMLYCMGGYGYSATDGDHITYPHVTAIDVPATIDAIVNNKSYAAYFRQITDTKLQITGGRLRKADGKLLLLGGQTFTGRYNPMGPDHGPGFEQEYSNSVKIFTIDDKYGSSFSIKHHKEYVDSINLHRRDYNAEPQIMPDGSQSVIMFSGVFRSDVDLPYLDAVTVDTSSYSVESNFEQYYNHYHCAVIPTYSESTNSMYTIFFGGIAQYYIEMGNRVKDDDVPFVQTIAVVKRDAKGNMSEIVLPVEMPSLLGASAEFIPSDIDRFSNEVIKYDDLNGDSVLLGYIYGGIESSGRNIFFSNTGSQSVATTKVFKVWLKKKQNASVKDLTGNSLIIHPNPASNLFSIDNNSSIEQHCKLVSVDGREVGAIIIKPQSNQVLRVEQLSSGVYFLQNQYGQTWRLIKQ